MLFIQYILSQKNGVNAYLEHKKFTKTLFNMDNLGEFIAYQVISTFSDSDFAKSNLNPDVNKSNGDKKWYAGLISSAAL